MLWTIQGVARDGDKLIVFWESTMDEGQMLAYLYGEMRDYSPETANELFLIFPNRPGYRQYEGEVIGPFEVIDVKEV